MKRIVQINQCPNCGGRLEQGGRPGILRCISCDSEFETEYDNGGEESANAAEDAKTEEAAKEKVSVKEEKKQTLGEFCKTEWFEYRVEYKKLCKGHDSKDCMKTFVHCCNELGNSEAIVKYIKRELSDVSGICCKGKREEKMDAFVGKAIKGQIGADETVYFYCNSGIFSCGKKGFVVTDKKIVFCEKKPQVIEYENLYKIAFDMDSDFVNVRLNGRYETTMSVIEGGPGKPHGAFAALISALAFEKEPGRDKIIVCEYDDDEE